MQLCALVSSKSSSAWTLATHEVGKPVFAEGLSKQDLVDVVVVVFLFKVRGGVGLFLFLLANKSTWTENREYTGLWSENLDSPLTYHICFIPSPFHNIRSHLQSLTRT